MDVRIAERTDEAAEIAAGWMAHQLRGAVERGGGATLALSGGSTVPPLLAALVTERLPWDRLGVWQVDERVAPDGDDDRNANQLDVLPDDASVQLMPVTAPHLDRAAIDYASGLPDVFDVVQLGVGPDGHTASWPPGDPVASSELLVDVSTEYQGRRRMTLTPIAVNGAHCRLVFVLGEEKADVMARWLLGDDTRPIGLVERQHTVVVMDAGAASKLPR